MGRAPLKTHERWMYALKPASWPKLGAPFLLGQALGIHASKRFDLEAFGIGAGFTLAYLVTIVLLNDWGDEPVDRIKRARFPSECSPKTIPDGILSSKALLTAGLIAGGIGLLIVLGGSAILRKPYLGLLGAGCLLVFQAYTFAPLRLNYRGGGELLEMLGIGLGLPWLNAYAQSGILFDPIYGFLIGHGMLSLASALASGLADEVSDREGGKVTFTTTLGNPWVRRSVHRLLRWSVFAWIGTAAVLGGPAWAPALAGSAIVLLYAREVERISPTALTNAFDAQRSYKNALHGAVWYGALALAMILWSQQGGPSR
ncbi:MAG: prenyltransferase [Myxococcales bacterium]|nr:prenyltransferase [Myxococcales bacterium]